MFVILNIFGLVDTHLLSDAGDFADGCVVVNSKGCELIILLLIIFICGWRDNGEDGTKN